VLPPSRTAGRAFDEAAAARTAGSPGRRGARLATRLLLLTLLLALVSGACSAPDGGQQPADRLVYSGWLPGSLGQGSLGQYVGPNEPDRGRATHMHTHMHTHTLASVAMTLPDPTFHEHAQSRWVQDPVHLWYLGMHPSCDPDTLLTLKEMLAAHKHVAAYSTADLPGYSGPVGPFRITTTQVPVYTRSRRHSPRDAAYATEHLADLAKNGIVGPAHGTEYSSEYTCAP